MRKKAKSNKMFIGIIIGLIVLIIILILNKGKKATSGKKNPVKRSFERLKKLKSVSTPANSIPTSTKIDYSNKKTWDIHSNRRIKTLHPSIRAKAIELIIRADKELGIKLRVTSAFRSWLDQTLLYKQGRTNKGRIVTNAKAGESYHNYGLAFDVVEIISGQPIWKNPKWRQIGKLGKAIGFEWGGDWRFKDWGHFQMRFGMHHTELAKLYFTKKKDNNGYILLT